ncbi:MAG TPA: hypothetical protein VFS66_11055 [Acidimicrobiia bacterium]|nr:hypothetical protein [Acidimicrobiia bacterium]
MRLKSERGASAIFVAIMLVVLMGMAAIAIDYGFGTSERRLDQGGVDASTLAGSLEMVITGQDNPVQAAVDYIYQMVDTNLDRTVPLSDWLACTDPNALFYTADDPMFGTTNASPCISLSSNFNTIRVKLPVQDVDTSFGVILGVDSIPVTAAAEAERNIDWGGGGDFPSGVFSGTQAGDVLCIKTGPSGQASCGDPTTGNFGFFRPYFYSAVDGDDSTICNTGEQPYSIPRAIADGIDHEFSGHQDPALPGGIDRVNGLWCQTSNTPGPPLPNMIRNTAGYSNADVTSGLITGGSWPTTFAGRLDRGPYQDGGTTIFGATIDNRPLWDFIDDTVNYTTQGAPKCDDAKAHPRFVADGTERDLAFADTLACMTEAMTVGPFPLFTNDILASQRIGHAPLLWETGFCGFASCEYHIKGLTPLFIDGVWADISGSFSCNGNFIDDGVMCVAQAGLQGQMSANPGQSRIDSASAIALDCGLMPSGTCPTLQDGNGPLNYLYDIQLTK